ncbi:flagellin [Diaphorobacter sp. MNS-0]|uniref:flagellin N-terminal helical domain-containing protein n=1 Tax=Diaphorobacter sp. MNS-0 TaxID=2866628 RepID=UPI001C735320|nr:flagellin [Diaphorobacter sp. MNS-0]QYY25289.1 flagellin FliC [Diaphorobacter sp. MNS-0]
MAMTINTNVASLNAQRNTALNTASLNTTMQRLSSGLRVNSAKDDAAGLAIADRMNTQVRGMNVAIRNAGDGVSMAQIAEGGLSGINDMLQRMRELAVQASNATNKPEDIQKLDQEYKELSKEVNRMVGATQFNGMTILQNSNAHTFQIGANASGVNQITVAAINMSSALTSVANANGVSLGSTNNAARATISKLDAALAQVNTNRATLGAVQSRFENTISYLRNAVENQSAARGRIMDADFASETANLSRAQILQQAGTAMIAQANQLPQGVLSLLR